MNLPVIQDIFWIFLVLLFFIKEDHFNYFLVITQIKFSKF